MDEYELKALLTRIAEALERMADQGEAEYDDAPEGASLSLTGAG